MENLILTSDAYKMTHWKLYPKGTQKVYSYLESRGGKHHSTVFFGLQIYLKKYLTQFQNLTQTHIDEADEFCKEVFGVDYFNRQGWEYIINELGGNLPIKIQAVPEGTLVPNKNVLMTIENIDTRVPWLTNFLETLLFEPMWYGTTVCTNSFFTKRLIKHFCDITGCQVSPFHLNDFGFRGVSSLESAGIGGAAHLVNFLGTDTLHGITYAKKYYSAKVVGHSVMASEHSVTTMYGKEFELEAYEAFLNECISGIVSVVLDSYDYEYALKEIVCNKLKDRILNREGKFVCRPDSGHPPTVAKMTLDILWENFGGTINQKGYKVINPKVGLIYGDGIDYDSINEILQTITNAGYSVENIIFGSGGALLQRVDRDQQRMAIKCSSGIVNGIERDVYKETKTDVSKASKRGRLALIKNVDNSFSTVNVNTTNYVVLRTDILQTVFENGKITKEYTFDEIRNNSNYYL